VETRRRPAAGPTNRVAPWLTPEEARAEANTVDYGAFVHHSHSLSCRVWGTTEREKTREVQELLDHPTARKEVPSSGVPTDWAELAHALMSRVQMERRVDGLEKQVRAIHGDLKFLREHCEKLSKSHVVVPVATLAPEPFDIIHEFSFVVQPDDECFVATLFDANLSSSGDTQEEAVANLKDLIIMAFNGFEDEPDDNLGPMMRRQKHALFSLIRKR
jgi:hypothetical protein